MFQCIKNGKIDFKKQSKNWENYKDPLKDRDHNDPNKRRVHKKAENNFDPEIDSDDGESTFQKAKKARAVYEAKLKKLEFEERSGKLIEKDFVKSAVFRFGKQVRDAVLTIPERVGAIYAAEATEILKEVLNKNISPKLAEAVLAELDQKEFENIARRVWANESRIVLETIEKGAKL